MDLGLTGRTALVLGASSGLGLATAEALREEGAAAPTRQKAAATRLNLLSGVRVVRMTAAARATARTARRRGSYDFLDVGTRHARVDESNIVRYMSYNISKEGLGAMYHQYFRELIRQGECGFGPRRFGAYGRFAGGFAEEGEMGGRGFRTGVTASCSLR